MSDFQRYAYIPIFFVHTHTQPMAQHLPQGITHTHTHTHTHTPGHRHIHPYITLPVLPLAGLVACLCREDVMGLVRIHEKLASGMYLTITQDERQCCTNLECDSVFKEMANKYLDDEERQPNLQCTTSSSG